MREVKYLNFDKDSMCVGCRACANKCPKNAIRIEGNDWGFYVPTINKDSCIQCGGCDSVCPVLSKEKKRVISDIECKYAYSLDYESRLVSASGGIFFEFAKYIIKKGGMVCGCVWNTDFEAIHICTNDIEKVKHMRTSKYVQSNTGDCFKQIKEGLKKGLVLFSGTPCQATALRNFIGENENLIICSIVCGGVPSPKVWKLYKEALEKQQGSRISYINMRTKKRSWLIPSLEVKYENGKEQIEVLTQNLYGANFFKGLQIAEACMNCHYKLDTVQADIILCDHWGIDYKMFIQSKDKGMSAIMLLSDKGKELLNGINDRLFITDGNIADIVESHHVLMKNHEQNENRTEFFANVDKVEIFDNFSRYQKHQNHKWIRRTLYKLGIYESVYKAIWIIRHVKIKQ